MTRMSQKQKDNLCKCVSGALRSAIQAHGPIDKLHIGCATKRIVGQVLQLYRETKNEAQNSIIRRRRRRSS